MPDQVDPPSTSLRPPEPRRQPETAEPDCVLTIDNDVDAFAALPDCPACSGCGKQVPPGWFGPPTGEEPT